MDFRELHDDAVALLDTIEHGAQWKRMQRGRIFELLRASDALLMQSYMDSIGETTSDLDSTGGELDAGGFLYFLNNPPEEAKPLVKLLVGALEVAEGMPLPASLFSKPFFDDMLNTIRKHGIVRPDGTIWGTKKYEQFDPGWLLTLAMLVVYELGLRKRHKFQKNPHTLEVPVCDKALRIAIVGDWGTGSYGKDGGPAAAVIRGIDHLDPDYIIHLGDVYYAGMRKEEKQHLLKMWSKELGNDRAFTLNSNHEMYDGANGYYKTALKDGGPFSAQKQNSYFAIRFGKWAILCLDSAYRSSPERLYMNGCIGKRSGAQATWMGQNFGDHDPQHLIVMTHHNPVTTIGDKIIDVSRKRSLWNVVNYGLGGRPPGYWYFGHIHNGIVYADKSAIGEAGTNGRLVGHGAIPYGLGSALSDRKKGGYIDYFGETLIAADPPRVRNGFAVIELQADGGIDEAFYEIGDQDSTPDRVWP